MEEQQQSDPVYQDIFEAVRSGTKLSALDSSHPIKDLRLDLSELQLIKGRKLMTYQGKIYIPSPAVRDVLKALYKGHAGFNRCLLAAKQTMFWPSMAKDIKREVKKCATMHGVF